MQAQTQQEKRIYHFLPFQSWTNLVLLVKLTALVLQMPFVRNVRQWLMPIINPKQSVVDLFEYRRYWRERRAYAAMPHSEPLLHSNDHPCLHDRTASHPLDAHYFYQAVWAFRAIMASGATHHVDIGSQTNLVGMLTTITHTTFVDIRPLELDLENYACRTGSILSLPFPDNSIQSLSCLHVAEHIGLGRYGDPLDPLGTQKACHELARVLAPGGQLFFSLPVGKPRVCFNAHRIHSPEQILSYLSPLTLVEFSAVDDSGHFHQDSDPADYLNANYACGLFRFTR
jgi:hypothetical protein